MMAAVEAARGTLRIASASRLVSTRFTSTIRRCWRPWSPPARVIWYCVSTASSSRKGSHHTRPSGGGSSTITSSIDTSTTSNSGKSGGVGRIAYADSNASAHSAPNQRRSEGYLQGAATYGEGGCLLDQNRMPVMMPWEEQLMCAHAARFVGPAFLNVGFGCARRHVRQGASAKGGVRSSRISSVPPPPDTDTHFPTPTYTPALVMGGADPPLRWHCICEAHTDVLTHLKSQGWPDKDGVEVWEGRWQDCVPPRLRAAGVGEWKIEEKRDRLLLPDDLLRHAR